MLIVHSFYNNNSFYIWGEHSFDSESADTTESILGVPKLFWCADAGELADALKRAGVRHSQKNAPAADAVTAFVQLPSRGGTPIPSSPLLGDIGDVPGDTELACYSVTAVAVTCGEIAALSAVIKNTDEKLSVPGLVFSQDMKFIVYALEYAAVMVCRGTYVPDMERLCDGFVSVWRPLLLAKYQDEYLDFVKSVPPVLRAVSFGASHTSALSGREETASAILCALLDYIVRSSQSVKQQGRKIDSSNPHEIWLRSLTWPKAPLNSWNEAMESLYPQVRSWADSIKAVTRQPWKLFLRLDEPMRGDDSETDSLWTLSWHLQSSRDPSLVIPAARVWSPDDAERIWFEREGLNPRRYMLQVLGHLASLVPAIAESLENPAPSECLLDTDELFEFLKEHVSGIIEQGIQVQFPASWGSLDDRPRLAVKGTLKDARHEQENTFSAGGQINLGDLLDVDWSVSLGEDILTEQELALITELKTPLVNIRGRWVVLYRDEIEKIVNGMKRLPREITRREALFASFSEGIGDTPVSAVDGSAWLNSIRAVLTGAEEIEPAEQPEGFSGTLRPYQGKGLSWLAWLAKLGLGGCLADDMGLGKTVQTLAMVQLLRNGGENRPILLVCPTSVIENWRRETEKFLPGTNILIHHGTKRLKGEKFAAAAANSVLVISSYSLLFRDNAMLAAASWCGVILDEAQNIKNPDTRQSRAARAVPADWHIALTGTPVENHVGDMWSIMEFLLPGLMPNKTRFAREFLRPIQAGEVKAMEKIKKLTAPFIMRRLKTDKNIIKDLPEKIETQVFCPLGREQASLYSAVLASLDEGIAEADGIKRKGLVLAAITSLKQVCDHPALYLKDKSELAGRSGKLARLADIAEEMLAAGDRALIFTQYAEMGAILKKFLQETFGREVLFLHGGVERKKRDEMVQRFQNGENPPPFFVLSLKAGGTGLNLTGANHVIMFDRWWNPAVEQQAVDRAYRIGQKSRVQVHYFCCKGTLEERIENLIESKRKIADSVVGSGESWISDMSDDDLRELFALGRDAVEEIN